MNEDLTAFEAKGRRLYWRAVVIWWFVALGGSAFYALVPTISISGKLIIGIALVGSAILLFRANSFSRYTAGSVALLGMLGSFPGTCAVFDPETQLQGAVSIVSLAIFGVVWHALLISDEVTAYLEWFRRSKGLKPEA